MWPLSRGWRDPLAACAPGTVFKSGTGLRVRQVGSGSSTLVFIHGLGGSLRYWGTAYDRLARERRLVFVDLLGFGGSDKPSGSYGLKQHSRVVRETLEEMKIQRFSIVGHSTGSAVAMHLASTSDFVSNVVAFAAPIFPSEASARRQLGKLGPLERSMAEGTELSVRMCRFMCNHRELSRRLAPLLVPRLPAAVASDGVDHTWESFSKTFDSLVRDFHARDWAREIGDGLALVYGAGDNVAPHRVATEALDGVQVSMKVIPGDHHLPLRKARACARLIETSVPNAAEARSGSA